MDITVRYANKNELNKINELRKMVNEVHASGRPDIFRSDICSEFCESLYKKYSADNSDVIAALIDGKICGFAVVEYIEKPLSSYSLERRFYEVAEFGVDPNFRRLGVATALINFCRSEASKKQFDRMELDVWELNEGAIKFYESVGFKTYRRYMESDVY